jgi:hypothetical protein
MVPFLKPNLMQFVSPGDIRTVALLIACAVAFYMGLRFEMVHTQRVVRQFTQYKLEQSQALAKAQQEALNEAIAAQAQIVEINENANRREAQLLADNRSLAARVRDERVRREALAKQVSKAGAASAACERDAASVGGELYGQAGEDIVSLIWEADTYLNSFADCQAYVKVIRKACE